MHQVVRSVASGDLLLTTPTQTVVLVGCLVASNKRAGKARLASEPPHRGDASPDAPLDASLHSTIQPFGAVWRFAAALWRRLVAPLGLPSSAGCASRWYHCRPVRHLLCWSHRLSPQPSDGSALAGVMAEPARLSALSALHSASGLPSLCAGGECMRAAPVSGTPRSRRTSLPLLPFLTPVLLHFAQLRTGLLGHSERQWKEAVGHDGWYVQTNG